MSYLPPVFFLLSTHGSLCYPPPSRGPCCPAPPLSVVPLPGLPRPSLAFFCPACLCGIEGSFQALSVRAALLHPHRCWAWELAPIRDLRWRQALQGPAEAPCPGSPSSPRLLWAV